MMCYAFDMGRVIFSFCTEMPAYSKNLYIHFSYTIIYLKTARYCSNSAYNKIFSFLLLKPNENNNPSMNHWMYIFHHIKDECNT